ncbi:hypothetical protein CMI37_30925 [Candidatus Pacearchaeota archaeon]|nr:hypothetical protein [Candidatus Pacearchaeota archaeon]
MNIPAKFNLMGQTIEVEYLKGLRVETDGVGEAAYGLNKIRIQENAEGNPRTREAIEETFCHELVHWILKMMEENNLRIDERFVGIFSGLLHQALSTFSWD